MRSDWLVVAVAGATCSGKTTLAKNLKDSYPGSELLHQDDYFFGVSSDRHTIVPQLNHINFEILSSLDNDAFLEKVTALLEGTVGDRKRNLLILEGFLVLNEPRLAALCDVKVFVTLDRDECWARRSVRTYDPPDPPGYFDLCVWPNYELHSSQVIAKYKDVVLLNGTDSRERLFEKTTAVISPYLSRLD